MKTKVLLLGLVLLTLLGGLAVYGYWRSSPEYAIKMAVQAYKSKNRAQFENFVNLDGVLSSAIDDGLLAVLKKDTKDPMAGALGGTFALKLAEMLKPQIIKSAKVAVLDHFEREIGVDDVAEAQTPPVPVGGPVVKNVLSKVRDSDLHFKGYQKSEKAGDMAIFNLHFEKSGEPSVNLSVKLILKKNEGAWKVEEVANIASLMEALNSKEL